MKIIEFMVGVKKGLVAILGKKKKKYRFSISEWQNLALRKVEFNIPPIAPK